jgi:hypothetical protein
MDCKGLHSRPKAKPLSRPDAGMGIYSENNSGCLRTMRNKCDELTCATPRSCFVAVTTVRTFPLAASCWTHQVVGSWYRSTKQPAINYGLPCTLTSTSKVLVDRVIVLRFPAGWKIVLLSVTPKSAVRPNLQFSGLEGPRFEAEHLALIYIYICKVIKLYSHA